VPPLTETNNFSFELVDPKAEVVSPSNANRPSVDVHVANAASAMPISMWFTGDAGCIAGLRVDPRRWPGISPSPASPASSESRTPIAIVIDDSGLSSYVEVLQPTTERSTATASVDAQDWYALLREPGRHPVPLLDRDD